jgi:preprotein translocase subunit YajC
MEPLLALFLTFALMWVLLIRPQQRRMRQHQEVVSSLRPGDEIVTAGGVYGTIQAIDEEKMTLEIAPGVVIRVLRAAVSQRVTADEGSSYDDTEYEETTSEIIQPRSEDDR